MIDRVITVGEALAVLRTTPGEPLWQTSRLAVGTGGAEANVAMTLARNGAAVTWVGRLGDDPFGHRIRRELRAEGVMTSVVWDVVRPTGLLVKGVRADGRTEVFNYRAGSAGSALSADDLDGLHLPLGAGSLTHVTGITSSLSASAAATITALLDRTQADGGLVSFDVNHRAKLWADRSAHDTYREIAARADIIFVSLDEVHFLVEQRTDRAETGADALLSALSTLHDAGFAHSVVTAGAEGAAARDHDLVASVSALPVVAVDSVGAGDAFVGGYLASWIRGDGLPERLDHARISGAAACRHPGDWEGAVDVSGLSDHGGTQTDPVVR